MIELRGITKRFGTTLAVRNLSFSAQDNEFLVIFGPAGAGKSTTLRMIAGIAEPNYGEVIFNGQCYNPIPPEKRNFSMVFENYALYSHLSVFDNLAFPLKARKLPEKEIREKVQKMADILQISAMLDRKPGFLSGGQRQRVALGRGLIRDADVYLLDEPISHLDARLRIQMRAELKRICMDKNANVIHVTHDYREAMALADKVIVLNGGKLMQQGSPEDVFHHPKNEFVARFVGDPPMSFINARYVVEEGSKGFRVTNENIFIPAADDFEFPAVSADEESGKIKLGIRANTTTMQLSGNTQHNVPATIYLVEAQGHRNLVTVKIEDDLLQIVTPPDQNWKVGQQTWVSLRPDNLHVFLDGQAIYHPVHTNVAA